MKRPHLPFLAALLLPFLAVATERSTPRGALPAADAMPIYPASPGLTNAPAPPPPGAPTARNWYAPLLLAPAADAPEGGPVIADALVVPEGVYATRRSAGEIVVAYPEALAAVVARYRAGLSPASAPVYFEHDRTRPAGRVVAVYYDAGRGLRVRMALAEAPEPGVRTSAELRLLSTPASDSAGTWGVIRIPWAILGVGLTRDPALETTTPVVQ